MIDPIDRPSYPGMTRAPGPSVKHECQIFPLPGTQINFHPSVALIKRPKMILDIFVAQTFATLDDIPWSRRSKRKVLQSERETR
jgi:hypothetical protein